MLRWVLVLTVGCAGWAKQSTEWNGGRCSGKVISESGEALAGATIVLSGSGKDSSTATTDADGRFELDAVPGQTQITAYYADIVDKKPRLSLDVQVRSEAVRSSNMLISLVSRTGHTSSY